MNFFIQTFGCAQNIAESERIITYYQNKGYQLTQKLDEANLVIINSCLVREQAEDRVYGFIHYKIKPVLKKNPQLKIALTGCLEGAARNQPNGYFSKRIKQATPTVELLDKTDIGLEITPCRQNKEHALIPIASGCNNFCSYCVVPLARGKEISRPFTSIINEAKEAYKNGYKKGKFYRIHFAKRQKGFTNYSQVYGKRENSYTISIFA